MVLPRFAGSLLALACVAAPSAAQVPNSAVIRGVVLDRADGTPLADVSVQVQDAGQAVTTDAAGRFELPGVQPGRRTVYVSIVGFILVKRDVDVAAGETLDLTIVLSEGTGTYTETLTVAGARFREQEAAVPAQQTLGSADIQNLRNLITNDPMRAIQVLPGVTTGDDFRSEFAVRGNGFGHMNFTFDGIASSFLLHTVQQVEDGGSIAMVNGDILSGISLMNGSYPQRHGNRLGAELGFQMREGSRDRTQVRAGVSGTDASLVVEGPFAGKAGSWLVSVRKSYLEMLLKQIDANNDFGFGFTDAQSKIVYDASPAHRLELTLVAGRSRLDQVVLPGDVNEVKDARNTGELVNLGWRFTASPSTVLTQRLAFAGNQFVNADPGGFALDRGAGRDLTWRADVIKAAGVNASLEGGAQVQWQQREHSARRFFGPGLQVGTLQSYDESAVRSSGYAQIRWSSGARLTLSPGARLDRWSLTGDTAISPWLQGELRLSGSLTLRGGTGVHRQFADFPVATGSRAGLELSPERAYHADLGLEQTIGESARWQVTAYNREERDLLRLPDVELRVLDGRLVGESLASRWVNALDGHARGVELLVQRRSASGLSGWASYSLGVTRYRDRLTGEAFDGDFDQRHTLNLHASYRLTNRTSVAAKLRSGSNVPALGYWERRGSQYFVSTVRNELRVPGYTRLDVRGSRTFNWRDKRLTLFVELLNALGRDNVRFNRPGVNGRTGEAFGLFESMIPRVPSAGILLEF